MPKFDPNVVLDFLVDFEIIYTVEADSVLAELEADITDDDLTDGESTLLDMRQWFDSEYAGPDLPRMLHADDPDRCIGEDFWGTLTTYRYEVSSVEDDDYDEDGLTDLESAQLDAEQFGFSKWSGQPMAEYVGPDDDLVDFLEYALGFPFDELAE